MRADTVDAEVLQIGKQADGEALMDRLTCFRKEHRVVHWYMIFVARVRMSLTNDREVPRWCWMNVIPGYTIESINFS